MRGVKIMMLVMAGLGLSGASHATVAPMRLAGLKRIATIDERFQSYNIEMAEIVGGQFWAPYGSPGGGMFRSRPPIDLADPRLIALARNLGPAYLRVSGTWANNSYVAAPGENLTAPPAGFKQVLTADQWRGVVRFAKAVDASIMTSFAVSTGTRDANGVWTPAQAQRLIDLTTASGGKIAAAEFFNEPNMPSAAQPMPKPYTAANYGTEFRIFRAWAGTAAPGMKIVGPGGIGEGGVIKTAPVVGMGAPVSSADMLAANPNSLDAVSYHFYGSLSQRCEAMKIGTAVKGEALQPQWLDRTLQEYHHYAGLRDRYEPGKPMWLTETAQAACGGSPWAATFLDTFRYLNQLGALAQQGVQVVAQNTLAASDYGLIDGDTVRPRPNYWAAVLWRRLMGSIVLAPPASPSPQLRLYAHCLRGKPGGVALLALNLGEAPVSLRIGHHALAWVITGVPLDTQTVTINGALPTGSPDGTLRNLDGKPVADILTVGGHSIVFLAVEGEDNPACR